jgi:hypothetical protein
MGTEDGGAWRPGRGGEYVCAGGGEESAGGGAVGCVSGGLAAGDWGC